ncbi:hypothetical protein [Kitasatospora sp. MBT63]|uniref:hypothetical protein n=1 Tax=Kitasatospora sp. MBT63 TaxID=1444768 RepID=UPI00053B8835|nr:hypothetical protein [Kitasatospora sp. MBT63]
MTEPAFPVPGSPAQFLAVTCSYGAMAAALGAVLLGFLLQGGPQSTLLGVAALVSLVLALTTAVGYRSFPYSRPVLVGTLASNLLMLLWGLILQGLALAGIVCSFVQGASVLGSGLRTTVVAVGFVLLNVLLRVCSRCLAAATGGRQPQPRPER